MFNSTEQVALLLPQSIKHIAHLSTPDNPLNEMKMQSALSQGENLYCRAVTGGRLKQSKENKAVKERNKN